MELSFRKKFFSDENLHLLFLCLIAVLLLFGTDFVLEYATDTYTSFMTSTWKHMFYGNGRIVNGIVYYLLEKLISLSENTVYSISYGSAVIFLTLSVFATAKRIRAFCTNPYWNVFLSAAIVSGLFIIELFLFIEKGLFMFGLLCTVIAFDQTISYWTDQKSSHLAAALLALLISVFTYQVIPGIYVVLCLPFILYYSKDFQNFIKNNLLVAGIYGITLGINLIITSFLFNSERAAMDVSLSIAMIQTIRTAIIYTIRSGYVAPVGFFALTIAFPLVIRVFGAIRTKSIKPVLQVIYLCAGVCFTAFLPFLFVTDDFALRIMYPYSALPGVLWLSIFLCEEERTVVFSRQRTFSVLFLFVFLVQMGSFNNIFIDRYKCNQSDQMLCEIIANRIDQYETASGLDVKYISFYYDASPEPSYRNLNSSQLIFRSFYYSWSDNYALRLYTNKKIKRIQSDEKWESYFSEKNWDTYSDDQLIFDGHTLHVCVY